MNPTRLTTPLLLALLFLLPVSPSARGADVMDTFLPPASCGSVWRIEGTPVFYNRETLSDRINGEAELYMPYGFDRMAAARFVPEKNPAVGMDVEIYRMGSPLDAFGMYANYRQKEGKAPALGAEANLSGSQLFFYQGRFFIHIQVTGAETVDPVTLAECGKSVAARLPGTTDRPPELKVFDRPETVRGSERYLPQSLLGYDFLNKGIMTDAVVDGANVQIFTLLGAATAALDSYRAQLAQVKLESAEKGAVFLEGLDPLYGPVMVVKKGECLAGALKFSGKKGIRAFLETICRH